MPSEREITAIKRVEDAVGWCVETGMTIREACKKTGANATTVGQRLRELRKQGANLALFDDATRQMRSSKARDAMIKHHRKKNK